MNGWSISNLTSRGTTSYTYDWQNHLVQKTDVSSTTDYVGDSYEKNLGTGVEIKQDALGSSLVASYTGKC